MVRKIIAKDIVIGNVRRSIQALDEYVKHYNKQHLSIKTETLVNELKSMNVNLNSFRLIKLEPMTLNTLSKTYNYNFFKYEYFIMFPTRTLINMCYIKKQYSGGLKLDRQGIRCSISASSQKEVIDTLRNGDAFLLVADKNIDVRTWRIDSTHRDKTHILDTLKAHDRVRVVDRNTSAIIVSGHNNKEVSLSSYDIIAYYRDYYSTTFTEYLDKSGYSRIHFQMQLKERLKEFLNNKVKEEFINGSTIKNMCDSILNYQIAVTVLPTDTNQIVYYIYTYHEDFRTLLYSYRNILKSAEDNEWESIKTDINRFNSMKERLDELLITINSLRTNVTEQQTCGI